MRTDYLAHDDRYKVLKADGKTGWTTPQDVDEIIADVDEALAACGLRGGRALELGCGAGEVTLRLAERGFEAYGVDISPTAIQWATEKAAERGAQVDFRAGNVTSLEAYADGFFDFVLDGLCLHCIIGDDRARFLSSVRRVLKPGGVFHVQTMCGDVTDPKVLEQFDLVSRCHVVHGLALRYIGAAEDIATEVEAAGLRILRRRVKPRKDLNDSDVLLLDATKAELYIGRPVSD